MLFERCSSEGAPKRGLGLLAVVSSIENSSRGRGGAIGRSSFSRYELCGNGKSRKSFEVALPLWFPCWLTVFERLELAL